MLADATAIDNAALIAKSLAAQQSTGVADGPMPAFEAPAPGSELR